MVSVIVFKDSLQRINIVSVFGSSSPLVTWRQSCVHEKTVRVTNDGGCLQVVCAGN